MKMPLCVTLKGAEHVPEDVLANVLEEPDRSGAWGGSKLIEQYRVGDYALCVCFGLAGIRGDPDPQQFCLFLKKRSFRNATRQPCDRSDISRNDDLSDAVDSGIGTQ